MKDRDYSCNGGCPVEAVLDLIGGRWKGVVLYNLVEGPVRFNELRRRMPNATQRVLTRQLREMEVAGLISRTVTPSIPPRVDYALTDLGLSLVPVISAMREWGAVYLDQTGGRKPTNRAIGVAAE
jgi:DNA-binding HxlR family transcriptional regulator